MRQDVVVGHKFREETFLFSPPDFPDYPSEAQAMLVLGISVCGFNRGELELLVNLIAEQQKEKRDFLPIFLTNSTAFDIFRNRGFAFEYLPWKNLQLVDGTESSASPVQERLAFLQKKWGIARIVDFSGIDFNTRCKN